MIVFPLLEDEAYNLFWKFVKEKIEEVPLDNNLSEEEFRKYKTSVILPEIGRMACTYEKYVGINKTKERLSKYKNGRKKV